MLYTFAREKKQNSFSAICCR